MDKNPLRLTIIDEETLDIVKDALLVCHTWLRTDAKYAHKKSQAAMAGSHVDMALTKLEEARSKYHRVNISLVDEPKDEIKEEIQSAIPN